MNLILVLMFFVIKVNILDSNQKVIQRYANGFPKKEFYKNQLTYYGSQEKRTHPRSKKDFSETEELIDEEHDSSPGQSLDQLQNAKGEEVQMQTRNEKPTSENRNAQFNDNNDEEKGGWWGWGIFKSPITWVGKWLGLPGFKKVKSTSTDDYYSNGTVVMRVPKKKNKKRRKNN